MRNVILLVAVLFCGVAAADTNVYARRVIVNNSAQADAELMARTGVLKHCGRNGGRRESVSRRLAPMLPCGRAVTTASTGSWRRPWRGRRFGVAGSP